MNLLLVRSVIVIFGCVIIGFHELRFISHDRLLSVHDRVRKLALIKNIHIENVESELCLLFRRLELAILHKHFSQIVRTQSPFNLRYQYNALEVMTYNHTELRNDPFKNKL